MATPSRLPRAFRLLTGLRLEPDATALAQVRRLGYAADDVRHIFLTHLDLDHAGGLSDFPRARVHLDALEVEAALAPRTLNEKARYLAKQWSHEPLWVRHRPRGERWFGFECVRDVPGMPPELLIVPLHGHTRGHAGVAVRTDSGWLLHAGDAYFYHGQLEPRPRQRLGTTLLERYDDMDRRARVDNQARLRKLRADHGEVRVFCAHDPSEYDRCLAAERDHDALPAAG